MGVKKMSVKHKFFLSPLFCLYNGAVIIQQQDNKIHFGLVRPEDTDLRMKLFQAFATYLRSEKVSCIPCLTFSLLTQRELLEYVFETSKTFGLKGSFNDAVNGVLL